PKRKNSHLQFPTGPPHRSPHWPHAAQPGRGDGRRHRGRHRRLPHVLQCRGAPATAGAGMSAPTVAELIRRTAERLAAPELVSEDPVMEARELIAHALGMLPRDLPRKHDDVLDARSHDAFLGLLSRRLPPQPTGSLGGDY